MAVPKLRFKEFDGAWKVSAFCELASHISYGLTVRPEYIDDGIKLISAREIASGKIDLINAPKISMDDFEALSDKAKPQKNDLFLSKTGSIGFTAIVDTDEEFAITQNIAVIRLNDVEKQIPLFHLHQMRTISFQRKAMSVVNQSTIMDLQLGDIKALEISHCSAKEQTKIASFFSTVDEKISQLTQKHELLSQYKQGMMQKLFSQQIRFKEDDGSEFGEWEYYKIFDLARDKTLNNGVFNDQNKVGKGYKLINVLDMYIQRDIDESRLCLLDTDKKEFERNKVNYGDIFFTRSSLVKEGIAFSNVYLGVSNDITYDGHLIKLSPDLNIVEPKFLNYCLKVSYVRKQLIQGGKTATMTTIGQQEVGNTLVKIPCLEEQSKIANFLSAIDQKIEVVVQQIEQAKQWKKGLLQQMFV